MVARLTRITSSEVSCNRRLLISAVEIRGRLTSSVSDGRIAFVVEVGNIMGCIVWGRSGATSDRVCSSFRFSTLMVFKKEIIEPVNLKKTQSRTVSRISTTRFCEQQKCREIQGLRGIFPTDLLTPEVTEEPKHRSPTDHYYVDRYYVDRSGRIRTVDSLRGNPEETHL